LKNSNIKELEPIVEAKFSIL